jgi:hypothetical protein
MKARFCAITVNATTIKQKIDEREVVVVRARETAIYSDAVDISN